MIELHTCDPYILTIRQSQVLVPLFDERARHWLLLQVDLRHQCMCVYDSLPPTKAKDKHERKSCIDQAVKITYLHCIRESPVPGFRLTNCCDCAESGCCASSYEN